MGLAGHTTVHISNLSVRDGRIGVNRLNKILGDCHGQSLTCRLLPSATGLFMCRFDPLHS